MSTWNNLERGLRAIVATKQASPEAIEAAIASAKQLHDGIVAELLANPPQFDEALEPHRDAIVDEYARSMVHALAVVFVHLLEKDLEIAALKSQPLAGVTVH